ncbi:MAG: chorismate synthase, partial [Clostridia bacterium]|nr:chorismate synthase [Clostridia bacterium]
SNGMPLTMRIAFRPTPSIGKEQQTVDLVNKNNVTIKIAGRHDACVAVRALPVVESMVCLALLDKGATL